MELLHKQFTLPDYSNNDLQCMHQGKHLEGAYHGDGKQWDGQDGHVSMNIQFIPRQLAVYHLKE